MRISKWKQYTLMRRYKTVAPYLPDTVQFSQTNFWAMLEKYKDVVVKPDWGRLGRNISKVSLIDEEEELYEIHRERVKERVQGKTETYTRVKEACRGRKYIVQQKIPLASMNGCPFDMRVMVQRLPRSAKWRVTGKLVRVAENGFFVTNAAQRLDLVENVLSSASVTECPLEDVSRKLQQVALAAVVPFQSVYPGCRMIGFDIGIQDDGRIWIVEANLNPMVSLFNYVDDKAMYRMIRKYLRE